MLVDHGLHYYEGIIRSILQYNRENSKSGNLCESA